MILPYGLVQITGSWPMRPVMHIDLGCVRWLMMDHDIVIVRAGACNICPLNRMRGLVINVTVIETGKEPGGTWFCAASVHWGC